MFILAERVQTARSLIMRLDLLAIAALVISNVRCVHASRSLVTRSGEAAITADGDRDDMLARQANGRSRRGRQRGASPVGARAARYKESVAIDSSVPGARNLKVITFYCCRHYTYFSVCTLQPIAMVLPEYHAIPEYERYCDNITEWKHMQRTPRTIGNNVMRFPHSDIGYYNFLDYDHRRYMRIMADHFGIYGFCFMHYWYKGRAIFHQAMEMILEDDEPDKPFFVVWGNEPLTRTKDGGRADVMIPLTYEDDRDNAAHFNYLMKLFSHKNYMTYDDRPILAINRADPDIFGSLVGLIEAWKELAAENGMREIFIIRILSDQNSDMGAQLFSGVIESEPGVFQPGAETYGSVEPGLHYNKQYTWKAIEEKKLRPRWSKDGMKNILGTYWNFNNAPRRIDSAGGYTHYPKIHYPDTLDGFGAHLYRLAERVSTSHFSKVLGYAIFLNSWNVWGDQSMFEPNDIDGYDALAVIKQVFLSSFQAQTPPGIVLHTARPENMLHVKQLQEIFNEYKHTFELMSEALKVTNEKNYVMVHVHHPGLDVTPQNIQACKDKGLPVYISVHDFLWLYPPATDFPSISFLSGATPRPGALSRTVTVFLLADVVIFPSNFVRSHYMRLPGLQEFETDYDRFVVVHPPDVMINLERISVPEISRFIGVALVGEFTPVMGSEAFVDLASTYDHVQSGLNKIGIKYRVLSNRKNCDLKLAANPMTLCTLDSSGEGLTEVIAGPNELHMLLFLTEYPDPYSYDLTTAINTGLPILYVNKGTLKERLAGIKSPRLFPIKDISELHTQYVEMLKYTVKMNGLTKGFKKSDRVQPSKWWLSNYPKRRGVA